MDKDVPADASHRVVVDAIKTAIAAIGREIKDGTLLAPYAAHQATGTKKKYITPAFVVARAIRADTGTVIARNTIYKDTLADIRTTVETQAKVFENMLSDLLNTLPTTELTEIELLKQELSVCKARCAKMQDQLHVMYAREWQHRKNTRKSPLSKRSTVISLK